MLICLTTLVSGLEKLDLYCLMDQRNPLLSVVSKGSIMEVMIVNNTASGVRKGSIVEVMQL